MIRTRFLFSVLLTFSFVYGFTQNHIRGQVHDFDTHETIIGATIQILTSSTGTTTNNHGYYQIPFPKTAADSLDVQISYVGYTPQTIRVANSSQKKNIYLRQQSFEAIEVVAQRQPSRLGTTAIPVERLKAVPLLFGEADVMKSLSLTPGVATGVEGTAGLYVRGGTPDQNLVLLDEATLYNSSHLFGFLSVFNPAAVKDVKLIKGAFPARYAGRLSSVIDVHTKEGNAQRKNSELTLGLMNTAYANSGKMGKNGTYLLATRVAHSVLVSLPSFIAHLIDSDEAFSNFLIYDLNAKLSWQLDERSKFYVSTYLGDDFYSEKVGRGQFASSNGFRWGNKTLTTRYTRAANNGMFSTLVAGVNQYDYRSNTRAATEQDSTTIKTANTSQVREFTLKYHTDFQFKPRHFLQWGAKFQWQQFIPNQIEFENANNEPLTLGETQVYRPLSFGTYAADSWQIVPQLKLDVGLHFSGYRIEQKTYLNTEPRISAKWTARNADYQIAYSRMVQYIHLLTNSGTGLSNDLWVPSTEMVPPQVADQFSLGRTQVWSALGLELTTEVFYKKLKRQIDFIQGSNFFLSTNSNWQTEIDRNGIGEVYGLEVFLKKDGRQFQGWLAYTWSKNRRKFTNINQGEWYPFKYDRRHDLSLTGVYKLNSKWECNANWVFSTGFAITIPEVGYTHFYGSPSLFSQSRNNARMLDYHRLDVSLVKRFKTKRQRDGSLIFGIYNLYGKRNPLYYDIDSVREYDQNGQEIARKTILVGESPLRWMPSVSYNVKW